MIFFDSPSDEYGCLCNDDQVDFRVGTTGFKSMTQYLMYCKARLFGDKKTALDIMYNYDPYIISNLGKRVTGFEEAVWKGRRGILLYRGLKAKFDQNPALIRKLVSTGTETLVYCGPIDPELGIGLFMTDPDRLDMAKWKGQNLLGYALMDLREQYQEQMPEGIRLKLQGRLSKDSLPGLAAALNGADYPSLEEEDRKPDCKYPPYEGEDPYICLNYSLRDIKIAMLIAESLTERGFNVWYDRFLKDGRLWSGERSDAIEKAFVLVDIESGEENFSHIRYFGREFAELTDVPVIEADVSEEGKKIPVKQIVSLLAEKGLKPGAKHPESTKRKPPRFDAAIYYYADFGADFGYFKRQTKYFCNLRTREVFHTDGSRKMTDLGPAYRYGRYFSKQEVPEYLSDEAVYRVTGWQRYDIGRIRKSAEPEYVGDPRDWAFAKRLAGLQGAVIPEIAQEYDEMQKKVDKALRDYPYMDEFEYMSSKDEE